MNYSAKKPRKPRAPKKTTAARKPRVTKSRAKPTCLVVLGMHRSGTSAMTGTLALLGCDTPKTLMPASTTNEKGYIESQRINDFLGHLLDSAASRWDDWLAIPDAWFNSARADEMQIQAVELLAEEFGTSRLFAFKNPRVCRLLPFWDRVWDEARVMPKFVMIHRDPVEVAASLESRDGLDPQLSMLIWLRHVLDAEIGSRGRPRSVVSYANLLQNWHQTVERLQSDLDTSFSRFSLGVTQEVEDFLSPSLRHFNGSSDATLNRTAVPDWVRQTHAILERWADTGEDKKDHAELDAIRQAFVASAPSFARIVQKGRDLTKAQADAETAFELRLQQEEELQNSLSLLETSYETLKDQRDADQRTADDSNAALHAQIAELNARAEDAERNAKQFQFEAEQGKQRSEQLRQERAKAVAALDTMRAETEHLKTDETAREDATAKSQIDAANARAEAAEHAAAQQTNLLEQEKADALAELETLRAKADEMAEDQDARDATLDALLRDLKDTQDMLAQVETDKDEETTGLKDSLRQHEISLIKFKEEAAEKKDAFWAKDEDTHGQLTDLKAELSQTQSALRQRSHEAEETAKRVVQLSEAAAGYEVKISKLTSKIVVENDSVEQLRNELCALRTKSEEDQRNRFAEIASLTENLLFHEANLNALNADLRSQLIEQTAVLASHKSDMRRLVPKLENSKRLADRVSDALRTILETNTVVSGIFRRLAYRRKARLIEALGLFDREWYLANNSDVSETKADPALHFVKHGYREGRSATPEVEQEKNNNA